MNGKLNRLIVNDGDMQRITAALFHFMDDFKHDIDSEPDDENREWHENETIALQRLYDSLIAGRTTNA